MTKYILGGIVVFFGILIVIGIIAFIGSWIGATAQVVGPANTSTQFQAVIGDWQGMLSAAENSCSAGQAKLGSNDPTFVEGPSLAYTATYRRLREDYNRRMNNFFEGGISKHILLPGGDLAGYPAFVPNFPEVSQKNGDFCNVADSLRAYHQ